ncbi:MAG TPA: glycosyl hydrolase family 65 protein, partial [Candidatus Dormibacteraeota bacterium]|nr:glycosyl hydrolase family 65 protein [Candidatus Dormibacteraeota bacterium]
VLAENWSGRLEIRAGLDGRVTNRGVRADRGFEGRHLVNVTSTPLADDAIQLTAETSQSTIRIAQTARLRVWVGARGPLASDAPCTEPGYVAHQVGVELGQGESATIEKVVTVFTSRDPAISEAGLAARQAVARAGTFDQLLEDHAAAWARLWIHFSLEVADQAVERVLRLHTFHLLQTLSRHTVDLDVGMPARGLHGEGYRGHIFWDEMMVLPFLSYRLPELTRELLRYRYRRLREARVLATEAGYAGAMFPWQSGSDGREETPSQLFNPRSGRWVRDNSRLQRHVNLAIAYNVWHYFQVTGDMDFLAGYGAELLLEIARFWTSLVTYAPARGRYEICGVMGPDEYHDRYPGAERSGIDNNAYTNVMVVWLLSRALELLELLPSYRCDELRLSLQLRPDETQQWDEIRSRMFVPFQADGVINQFEGYERLAELDWDTYRSRYGNIGRLDLILEAEGDTANRYKLSKQADVLMLFYLLSADELRDLLHGLGYSLPPEAITRTVNYYLARTAHGSTLSRVVDAWVLARSDRRRSWASFTEALAADAADTQGGTTAEGIHLGAMAGTLDMLQRCYTGLEARSGVLWINPALPDELPSLSLELLYRGHWISLHITREWLRVASQPCAASPIPIGVRGAIHQVSAGTVQEFTLSPRIQGPKPHAIERQ